MPFCPFANANLRFLQSRVTSRTRLVGHSELTAHTTIPHPCRFHSARLLAKRCFVRPLGVRGRAVLRLRFMFLWAGEFCSCFVT